jgi:hypothetical protein
MASTYQRRIKIYNGTDYDEFHPLTDASVVNMSDGTTVENKLKMYTTTNSGNAYSVTIPNLTSLTDGLNIRVKFNVASTGAITLNINSLGAKSVKDYFGNSVTNVRANLPANLVYESTSSSFILLGKGGGGNATAGTLLASYTATVDSGQITGTIPSKSSQTYTPGTSNQTIASGQYLSGSQTILGDANLAAPNILKGKSIFNVAGGIDLSNLTPDNVKENVNINGVIGTVEEKLNIQDCLLNIMQNTSIRTLECFIKNEGLWCKDDTNTLCLYDINSNLVKTISPSILINVVTGDYKITAAYFLYLDEQYIIWNITCNSVSSSGTYYFILLTDKRANIIHRYSISGTSAAGACIFNNKIYIFYDYGGTRVYIDGYDILTGNSIASFDINSITNLGLHSIYNVYYFNNLGTKILLNCICSDGDDYYSIVICIDTVNNVIVFNNKFKGAESSTYLLLNKLCASTFF